MKKRGKNQDWIIWCFFAPFVVMGGVLLILSTIQLVQHIRSLSWQESAATVLSVGRDVARRADGSEAIFAASRPIGQYRYVWDGVVYENDAIAFSNLKTRTVGRDDDWQTRLYQAMAEPGQSIQIWVNPSNPRESVVIRDLNWFELGIFIGFGGLMSISGVLMLSQLKRKANVTPQFSWRVVSVMWGVGVYLGVIALLLWRDGHSIWAIFCLIPLALAAHGTRVGLRRRSSVR